MKKIYLLLLAVVWTACQKKETVIQTVTKKGGTKDTHTFSEPEKAVVTHLDLDIVVDFSNRILSGKASWTIDNKSKGNAIVFDQNGLEITKVTLGNDDTPTEFESGDPVEFHGRPLKIAIAPNTTRVNIYYKTTQDAVALQWLAPEQTADKKHPFLFSQGQSIWTRTWVPCQDSPAIRFTYDAKVTVPQNLMAVMSAVNPQQKNGTGVYQFKQDKPIPSYLMALAVGDIAFKPIDHRTGVYAEPSVLDKAAWEFGELGKMVYAAEELFGPYRWGRYDVLVLPPSFPYGGMENPNLTFLTPGVIAGDRSLTSLLAHELGHSWSGNLVTNATWDDIWLNEGFTTYVEHRIGEAIYGKQEADMQDVLSRKVLSDNLADYGVNHPATALKVNVDGQNADNSLTDIPYEKGYAFLQVVEQAVGRERFDAFITEYFNTYAFKSIHTDEFLRYFNDKLIRGDQLLADKIKADQWIFKPDLPDNITKVASADFERIDEIQRSWRKTGVSGLAKKIRSTNERQRFIDYLPEDLTVPEMAAIDREFRFTELGNFVIKRQWFVQAIRHRYSPAYPEIEKFLIATSRTGSLHTLYKEMVKTPDGKLWAKRIFEQAKPGYHGTTVQDLEVLLR